MIAYCDVVPRGPEPPRLWGANVVKAVTRALTPPGQGAVEAAATAAQNKPAAVPSGGATSAQYVGGGVNTTEVPGYSPWLSADLVSSPAVQHYTPTPGAAMTDYQPVPGAAYVPTAANEQFQYNAAPSLNYTDVNPETLAAADAYVQRGLSNDTGFGVDPNVEWAIKNQDAQFQQQQADLGGPNWQASTLGQQGQAFRDVADAAQRFAARQAALTTGVGVQANLRNQSAQRQGLALAGNQQNIQQAEQQATMNQQNNQFRTASDVGQGQFNANLASSQNEFGANLAQNNLQYNATNAATQAMFGAGLDVQQLQNNAQFQAQQNAQNANLMASQRNTDTAGRFGIQMQGNQLQQGNQQYAANSIASGISGIGGLLGGAVGLMMSDAREKEDIVPMFKHKGVMFYSYSEKDDPEKRMRIGPMAQEIALKRPDAVHEDERGVLHIGANALRHMLT